MDVTTFCGCDNKSVQVYRSAIQQGKTYEDARSDLQNILTSIRNAASGGEDQLVWKQAEGITQALLAEIAKVCGQNPDCVRSFQEAVECIEEVMPGLVATVADINSVTDEWDRNQLSNFSGGPPKLGAAVTVLDFMRRMRGIRDDGHDFVADHTVETPVLFRVGSSQTSPGFVGILRVELIRDGISAITPDLSTFGACTIHSTDASNVDSLHESVLRMWKLAGLEECRARWSIRPFQAGADKTETPLSKRQLAGRSMEAAMLSALWAANGGIPGDDYRSDKAFAMEPKVAVTGVVTDRRDPEPGSFEIDAVYGILSKLKEAKNLRLESVVLADKPKHGGDDAMRKFRQDAEDAYEEHVENERRRLKNVARQSRLDNTDQLFDLSIVRVGTAREVFDSLLVTNRWLAKWQAETRENWLKRWECRPKDANGNFVHGGARAPGDDAPGPDDKNLPRLVEQA